MSTIQDKKRVQLACIFTDTRHPIAIEHVRARARAFPSYNFEIMQKGRVRAWWARGERGSRHEMVRDRLSSGMSRSVSRWMPVEIASASRITPGNTGFIYLLESVNYPFPICVHASFPLQNSVKKRGYVSPSLSRRRRRRRKIYIF